MILVGNGKRDGWINGHYIGRAGRGKAGSALANPFKIGVHGDRDAMIERYRNWLLQKVRDRDQKVMAELQLLKEQASLGDLRLPCFCKPSPCHGDVVKQYLEEMLPEEGMQ